MPLSRRPLWLLQAKCLSHYQANLVAPDEYERDDSLGRGDVMHLTCVAENGATVAVLVPGSFQKCIWLQVDPRLELEDFQALTRGLFSRDLVGAAETDEMEAVPVFSDGGRRVFFSVRFSAKSKKAARELAEAVDELLGGRVERCEARYTPEARFVDERGVAFCTWLYLEGGRRVFPLHQKTRETEEWVCDAEGIVDAPELRDRAAPPLRVVSFDVETRNKVWIENDVPLPGNRESSMYSVAVTVHTVGTSAPERAYYVLVRPPRAPPALTEAFLQANTKFTHVSIVENETQLVQRINDIFVETAPVFLTGHNIVNYDLPWILQRGAASAHRWARRRGQGVTCRKTERDSGALGKNDTFLIESERIILDLLPYMKENEKGLDDYKLNTIAKSILPQLGAEGRAKVALRYEDQFCLYTESDRLEDHILLAEYVYTDADLVPDILTTYSAVEKLIAASRVAKTPLEKMLAGQQVRAYHAILHEAHRQGFVVNRPPERQIQEYKGGYVQDPVPQMVMNYVRDGQTYFCTQTTLDFQSLYPSIMRQFALCFTTFSGGDAYERLVDAYEIVKLTEDAADILKKARAASRALEAAVNHARFEQVRKLRERLQDTQEQCMALFVEAHEMAGRRLQEHFFFDTTRANLEHARALQATVELEVPLELHLPCFRNQDGGIIPTLIERYMTERKRYKKQMKEAYGKARAAETAAERARWTAENEHLDSAQLAVKVMVNSLYGFTGVKPPKATLPLVAIAATTTCAGRWSIKKTQALSQVDHTLEVDGGLTVHFTTDVARLHAWTPRAGEEMVYTEMIYGDTDSIMPKIVYKQPSVLDDRLVFERMMEAETQRINRELRVICAEMGYDRPFLVLEFEKHGPMLVKGPKMYALYKHEPGKPPKLTVTGLKPARRDNAPMLKSLFMQVLHKRLVDNDTHGALQAVVDWLQRVKDNAVPMADYHVTTAVGRNYKNPNLLQPTLQRKIRGHGGVCDSGDRVHYVVCRQGHKVAEKAEAPEYVTLKDVDRVWYVDTHVKSSILELFDIFGDVRTEFVDKMFRDACQTIQAQHGAQKQLQAFFAPLPRGEKRAPKRAVETPKASRKTPKKQATLALVVQKKQ